MQMIGDTLRPVPGGERFTGSEITLVLPYGSGRDESLLVGTRDFRLFVQSGGAFAPFAAATREDTRRKCCCAARRAARMARSCWRRNIAAC